MPERLHMQPGPAEAGLAFTLYGVVMEELSVRIRSVRILRSCLRRQKLKHEPPLSIYVACLDSFSLRKRLQCSSYLKMLALKRQTTMFIAERESIKPSYAEVAFGPIRQGSGEAETMSPFCRLTVPSVSSDAISCVKRGGFGRESGRSSYSAGK